MSRFLTTLLGGASTAMVWAMPAIAQTGPENAGETGSERNAIIVTAQTRAESLDDVPISISAVSSETLEAADISNITQLIPYVPGLTGSSTGQATNVWNVRGIGTNDWSVGSEPAVAVFLDGAYIGRNVNATAAFFDVERIEVVRGPQGTLFGRNASAGAISIISNKPEDATNLQVGLSVGNQEQIEGVVIGNARVSDAVRLRLAYRHEEIDGIQFAEGIDDELGTRTDTLRITAAIDVTPDTELLASFHFSDLYSTSGRLHNPSLAGLLGLPGGNDPFAERVTANSDTFEEAELFGGNLRITHEFGSGLTLTSITDYRTWNYSFQQDLDGIGAILPVDLGDAFFGIPGSIVTFGDPVFAQPDIGADTISQELRLNGSTGPVDWFVGASYFGEEVNENAVFTWPMNFDADVLLGGGGVVTIFDQTAPARYAITGNYDSFGIYGDVTIAATDWLSLTGGLRWTSDQKDFCSTNVDPSFGFIQLLGPDTMGQTICGSNNSDRLTYRVVGEIQATDDLLFYASYATGYKGGGFNSGTVGSGPFGIDAPFALVPFDPETSDSLEFGAKITLLGGDLQFNSAVYFTDYDDLQLLDTALSLRIDNVATVESNGFEADLLWQPVAIEGLTVTANYSYNDSEISAPGQPINGSVLPIAPEHTFAATVSYTHDIGDIGELTWFGGYSWQDDIVFDISGARVPQDAYGTADAALTFRPRSGAFDVTLSASNLFDEDYLATAADPLGLGFPILQRGRPMLYMLRFNLYFGDR